jgi:hypothetical protein
VQVETPIATLMDSECRLDGVIRKVDTARQVVEMELLSSTGKDGVAHSIRAPEKRWIRLTGCKITDRNADHRTCGLTDLAAGAKVTAIGKQVHPGEAMPAREILFTPIAQDDDVPLHYIPALFPEDDSQPAKPSSGHGKK